MWRFENLKMKKTQLFKFSNYIIFKFSNQKNYGRCFCSNIVDYV